MFVLTGGSTSSNIPSVMDEIVFKLELFSTFNSSSFLRWTSSSPRRWTPTSRPVEYISTGVYAASSFSSSISLHPETWETHSQRKAEGSNEDCTSHYKPYKTILFYEAPAAHVELTPSKLNSGGVESDRDQNHLHFYKAFMDEVRCPMSHLHLDVRGNL